MSWAMDWAMGTEMRSGAGSATVLGEVGLEDLLGGLAMLSYLLRID